MTLRWAGEEDGDALAAVYAPAVTDGVASFELEPPSGTEMARRLAATMPAFPWMVLERGGEVVGFAYAHPFHARAAYDWSAETSIYIARAHHRTGAGRALYTALLAILHAQGFCRAVAGITLPNPASVGLHESVGFRKVGVYHRIGWKFDAWHDVGHWELDLRPDAWRPAPPAAATSLPEAFLERVWHGGR